MTTGIVFDLKEFAVHDGPGLRITVFLKGCLLNCTWCHNPEGKSPLPQMVHTPFSDRQAGRVYTAQELAGRLNALAPVLNSSGGGVTFSGGEPLLQAGFVSEVAELLEIKHILLDTSGYGRLEDFARLMQFVDLVYFDLKLMDAELFRRYTGGNIAVVMKNLEYLKRTGMPFVIRVPLVPGVTDTHENLTSIAGAVRGSSGLVRVDLLPYNILAGAKYPAVGLEFTPGFDETCKPRLSGKAFEEAGLPWRIV
jgi:pyruvate formate lyase activating enzyme